MGCDVWTADRVILLKALWRQGLSATAVAARLGSVTRSAVLGKLHRLGLSRSRPSPPPRPSSAKPRLGRSRSVLARPSTASRALTAPQSPGSVADVLELAPGLCRWPIGDPKDPDFSFCGLACRGPYCATHRARAYRRRVRVAVAAAA
jgi:GcrA cell cycle regulator